MSLFLFSIAIALLLIRWCWSYAGFWDWGAKNVIKNFRETESYAGDWIGLQTLDKVLYAIAPVLYFHDTISNESCLTSLYLCFIFTIPIAWWPWWSYTKSPLRISLISRGNVLSCSAIGWQSDLEVDSRRPHAMGRWVLEHSSDAAFRRQNRQCSYVTAAAASCTHRGQVVESHDHSVFGRLISQALFHDLQKRYIQHNYAIWQFL